MIRHIAVATTALAALAAPSNCSAPSGNGSGSGANAATQRVCDQIGEAGRVDELPDHSQETFIKLAAAKDGVPKSIRDAIDAYYSKGGETGANVTRLYAACKDAGAPQSTS